LFQKYGIFRIPAMVLVTFDQRNEVTIKDLNDLEQVEQAVTSFLSDFSHSEASKPVVNTRQSTLPKGYHIVEITGVGKRGDGKGILNGKTIYVRGSKKEDIGHPFTVRIVKDMGEYMLGEAVEREIELSPGSRLTLKAEEKSLKGTDPIGYVNGKITFIQKGIVGRTYEVEIEKVSPTFNTARIVREIQ